MLAVDDSRGMTSTDPVTIRRAGAHDALALLELAELDSAAPLSGEVLLAEVGGQAWAAIEVDTRRVVADPFRPTAGIVELLGLRASRLGAQDRRADRPSLLRRYATRWGYSASTSSR